MKKVKVGGKLYNIILTNENEDKVFVENIDANGYIEYPTSLIKIRNNNSSDTIQETILHEVLHALLDNSGVDDVNLDKMIKVITPRLHAFFVDNPDFVNYLLNKT